jgi:short-subunit dehydrogenase
MIGSTKGIIVITGASKGLGQATVRSLVQEHDQHVLAVSRDGTALEELRKECGDRVEVLALDIADEQAPIYIRKKVGDRRVVGLIHNAGLFYSRRIGDHQRSELEKAFLVNTIAPFMITQQLVDCMKGDPPVHVVHIGSMGGFQDSVKFPGNIVYSGSKAALSCMAQCLAEELRDHGIRSNCLALGSVDTQMLREAFPGFKAGASAEAMGSYVARFTLEGHFLYNGKVLPVAVTTP